MGPSGKGPDRAALAVTLLWLLCFVFSCFVLFHFHLVRMLTLAFSSMMTPLNACTARTLPASFLVEFANNNHVLYAGCCVTEELRVVHTPAVVFFVGVIIFQKKLSIRAWCPFFRAIRSPRVPFCIPWLARVAAGFARASCISGDCLGEECK